MTGRISRLEFWLGHGLFIILVLLLEVKLAVRQPTSPDELAFTLALPLYFINAVLFWPVTAIVVKRLHDLNLSGWWVAVSLVLSYLSAVTNICSLVFLFATAMMLAGLPPGSHGRNSFGTFTPGASAGLKLRRRLSL